MANPLDKIEAFRAFEKQLKKYTEATDKPVQITSKDKALGEAIKQQDLSFEEKITLKYKKIINPVSIEIENDLQSLLNAWELFTKIQELNENTQDPKTYISDFVINSPLTRNPLYVSGVQTNQSLSFACLQAWFLYEKGIEDYVPVINQSQKVPKLEFIPSQSFNPDSNTRRIFSIIKQKFYT